MTRARNLFQALIWAGMLIGLTIVLIGLFGSANQPQTASRPQQTIIPTAEATVVSTPEPPEVLPTVVSPIATTVLEPRTAGILFESAGEMYWQPVDEQGKALTPVARVPIDLAEGNKIGKLFPAPDGSLVVYELYSMPPAGCCELESTLYVFSPPDGQPRQIDAPPSIAKLFGWHPNSQQLVYGEGTIELFNVNSGERTTLIGQIEKWADLPYGPQIDGLAFSPDGKRLIVSYTLTGQTWEVWMVNADGSGPRMLFKEGHPIAGIAWSPDGKSIAFVGDGVEVMSSEGENRRAVGPGFTGGAFPAWSPDSRHIAYTAAESFSEYKIRIIDVTSDTYRNLLSGDDRSDVLPVWSPDGSWILFLGNWSDERGASEVWIASLDGTVLQQLTSDEQPKRSAPIWLPELGGN
jgi:WD40 repeat protein